MVEAGSGTTYVQVVFRPSGDKLVTYLLVENRQGSPAGQFDVMVADMTIISNDGTVTQIIGETATGACGTGGAPGNTTNLTCVSEKVNSATDFAGPPSTTRYYVSDQVGTAQLELTSGGWPLWKGEFTPFGQEIDLQSTANKYKFTGKERDAESGLDYFGARYYASNVGRWMSPDWAEKPEAVPYSDLSNPQSLNLYAYVNNNPTRSFDPDGHGLFDAICNISGGPSCEAEADGSWTWRSQKAQQQGLSSKSGKAIDKASKKYGYDASAFKAAMTQAGSKYKLNPNLLVGLGMRESSLNPSQSNGGLFQIQDPKAYGIDPKDLGNFEVQIPAAAAFLSGNISHFNGNIDLGVAAWTLGRGGTSHFFNEGGMPAVRGALLSAKHPDYGTVGGYIDFITSF
jgi:RHS repeat-associated protein